MGRCYSDPLTASHVDLSHLNLVFAIGLSFATPEAQTDAAIVVGKLRSLYPNQGETFYLNAKSLANPLVGFEDGDLWTIQALLLVAIFMATRCKRNTAFAYVGRDSSLH